MNKIINIKSFKAIKEIREFKDKLFSPCDIRFTNIHLKKLNKILRTELFSKNDLYINSRTLWELMQLVGNTGTHNYHGLTPEDIFNVMNSITEPIAIYKVKNERYAIIPVYISSFSVPLKVVVQIDAGLMNNQNAKINKIVTIYPRNDIESDLKTINAKNILYKK